VSEPRRRLSPSLERNPELDAWIRIETDGRITVFTGKVELGQGLRSALARLAAEELDVALERIDVASADTSQSPDELLTVGSMSMEHSGSAVRQAAAEARHFMVELAAQSLGVPLALVEVEDGTIRVRGSAVRTTYWELFGGKRFERRINGEVFPKDPSEHRIVGRLGPRIDLRAKLTGGAFLQDLALPGMLFGRVVRPPSPAARLLELDERAARTLPSVRAIVHDGSFVGVVAEREEQAERARELLRDGARWEERATLPGSEHLQTHLLAQPRQSFRVVNGAGVEGELEPHVDVPDAARTLAARYTRPFQMHASIGPSAALARVDDAGLTVWSHSQGITLLRPALAHALGIPVERLRVIHADGAGSYGHNGADDAALDAALLARAVPGSAVLLQWMRDDEHAWEPYGPAMCIELRASLDAQGRIVDWNHETFSYTHAGRPVPLPERSNLLAAQHRASPLRPISARPRLEPHAGIHRNADPYYEIPRTRVVKHFVENPPLRTSSLRGLGAFANVFAIESFMDEIAAAAGCDPLELRLAHLRDERSRAVLRAAAERAGWPGRTLPGRAQGLAFARYKNEKCHAAVVVDLEADAASGAIRLHRAVIAADAGEIIDPDGLVNQLEGGFVQAASWTLKEEVRFDTTRIASRDWDGYPILRFDEIPEIETVLLDRPGERFLGAGEATQGPTPAAIANALARAIGRRVRDLPLRPERVRAG
jgi:nicotinate dehydrogenase subunit B